MKTEQMQSREMKELINSLARAITWPDRRLSGTKRLSLSIGKGKPAEMGMRQGGPRCAIRKKTTPVRSAARLQAPMQTKPDSSLLESHLPRRDLGSKALRLSHLIRRLLGSNEQPSIGYISKRGKMQGQRARSTIKASASMHVCPTSA